jgi:hypothetical protein
MENEWGLNDQYPIFNIDLYKRSACISIICGKYSEKVGCPRSEVWVVKRKLSVLCDLFSANSVVKNGKVRWMRVNQ